MPRKKQAEETGLKRKDLLAVVNKLRPAIASKDVVEQARSVVFKDGFAWSYNDEVAVSHPLPPGIEIEGAVDAGLLSAFLSKAKGDGLALAVVGGELRLTCGRSKAGIAMEEARLPIDKIPMPEDGDWTDLPEEFVAAANRASLACSSDMSTPVLSCVYVCGHYAIGCDNFRITRTEYKGEIAECLIPAAAIRHLKEFAPEAFAVVEGWVHFVNKADVVFSSRTVDGDYPDVAPLLDVRGEEVELPGPLVGALDQAEVFAEAEFEQDESVELEADGQGTLLVVGRGIGGWFREELEMPEEVAPFKFSVHPGILRDAMALSTKVVVGENALRLGGEGFVHVVALA